MLQTWPLQADNTQKIHETGKHLMVGILSYSIHPEFGIAKKKKKNLSDCILGSAEGHKEGLCALVTPR